MEPALAPLAFVGMAPALFALSAGPARFARTMALSWVAAGTFVFLVGLPLLSISFGAVVILPSLILPWPWAALLVFSVLRRHTGWPMGLLWPCCWVLAEWGSSFHSVGALAFGLSGYTQAVFPRLIQFAEFTGVLGVSFLVQAIVGSLADVVVTRSATGSPLRVTDPRVRRPLHICGAGVLIALIWGTLRLGNVLPNPGPTLALVQPAVPHRDDDAHMRLVQLRQLGLGRTIRRGEVDLIVFPENAVLRYIEGSSYLDEFRDLSKRTATPLLVGVAARPRQPPRFAKPGARYAHNSAAIITGDGVVERYDKLHLMPFSEQVPAEPFFSAIGQLEGYRRFIVARLGYHGTAVPGEGMRLLRVPGHAAPMWAPICFEQADARLARQAALQGARYFVNLTSEGDLGPRVYRNTEAIAIMRAIELRVGIARCGNVGITATIDPWGQRTDVLRDETGAIQEGAGVLRTTVQLGTGQPTVYARLGDWPAGTSALVLVAALGSAVARRPRRRRS